MKVLPICPERMESDRCFLRARPWSFLFSFVPWVSDSAWSKAGHQIFSEWINARGQRGCWRGCQNLGLMKPIEKSTLVRFLSPDICPKDRRLMMHLFQKQWGCSALPAEGLWASWALPRTEGCAEAILSLYVPDAAGLFCTSFPGIKDRVSDGCLLIRSLSTQDSFLYLSVMRKWYSWHQHTRVPQSCAVLLLYSHGLTSFPRLLSSLFFFFFKRNYF